jgi:hypothetical protein
MRSVKRPVMVGRAWFDARCSKDVQHIVQSGCWTCPAGCVGTMFEPGSWTLPVRRCERIIIIIIIIIIRGRVLTEEPCSSGSIVSDYGLDDRAIGIRSPTGAKVFSSNLCVQTGSGAHQASCTMDTGGPFPGA